MATTPTGTPEDGTIAILIPVYNDWTSLSALLPHLSAVLEQAGLRATLVVVDDGSSEQWTGSGAPGRYAALPRMLLISLRRNLGHQRAIAVGLATLHERLPHDIVVVMDGDGEDRPEDVPRLIAEVRQHGGRSIAFAERIRRSEGLVFAVGYHMYRLAHLALTGERVRFGNFSAVPWPCLERLVSVSELWSHYAAAVVRSRIPYVGIRTHRAKRLAGRPRMGFTGLVVHGLSALALFSDVIGVRLLLTALVLLGAGAVLWLGQAFLTPRVPTALDVMTIALVVVVALCAMLAFTFMILAGRKNSEFVPLRDYGLFVLRIGDL